MSSLPLSSLLVALVPLSWLLSNHYFPWLSAWLEGAALVLVVAAGLLTRRTGSLPLAWCAALAAMAVSLGVHGLAGSQLYGGDAVMVLLFFAAFALAFSLGSGLGRPGAEGDLAVDVLAWGLVGAALVSVLIALAQWVGQSVPLLFTVEIAPGARPSANLAQANHLCSAAFLGLSAALLLHDAGRIGRGLLALLAGLLVVGMTMSGSRTGWLQMAMLVLGLLLAGRRVGSRLGVTWAAGLAAGYVVALGLWPAVNDWALLSGARELGAQMSGGVRLPYWTAMLDAIGRAPWLGYGWLQQAQAQWVVALDHPVIGYRFDHAHNLLLDLALQAGLPLALAIALLAGHALWAQARALREPRSAWLFLGVLGLLVHAMLEYPLHYAYFLLPAAAMLGVCHARNPALRAWSASLSAQRGLAAACGLVLGVVVVDYLEAERSYRTLALESARIGSLRIESPPPEMHLLSQLQAVLTYARREARPLMTQAELQEAHRVVQRYPMPPVTLRYALAMGLNGRPEEARAALARLCRMQTTARCQELAPAWTALQARFPQLHAIELPPEARPAP